jgi:hypothetical protein
VLTQFEEHSVFASRDADGRIVAEHPIFRLRIDADATPRVMSAPRDEIEYLLERRNRIFAIVGV